MNCSTIEIEAISEKIWSQSKMFQTYNYRANKIVEFFIKNIWIEVIVNGKEEIETGKKL